MHKLLRVLLVGSGLALQPAYAEKVAQARGFQPESGTIAVYGTIVESPTTVQVVGVSRVYSLKRADFFAFNNLETRSEKVQRIYRIPASKAHTTQRKDLVSKGLVSK